MHAISFNERLYPFVKKYQQPLLPTSIYYHTWGDADNMGTPFNKETSLSSELYLSNLQSKAYYFDPRVKTILSHLRIRVQPVRLLGNSGDIPESCGRSLNSLKVFDPIFLQKVGGVWGQHPNSSFSLPQRLT